MYNTSPETYKKLFESQNCGQRIKKPRPIPRMQFDVFKIKNIVNKSQHKNALT